ncbi:Hsp33 family molecular chaperone HslO [Tepidibacter formicigenes]|jgi:molecular chaperone Hsp33|uniref:33 kDa chaperonin n=1 Tax=Tepidibacter formicigenes DSM 15518 TaxID=1123349 RepID=A0A1M6ML34_9FIRM|nr:Hsp33 family molecular chaperone HslO [Tepidibacter formicigenes]SHJ84134.1 molecular chaperone Hsp33 [Tepidibacter formicigenes DSM 15518]
MNNYVIRASAGNHSIRAFAAFTTDMVEKARKLHNTTPVASAALGRTLTASSIMGLMMKNKGDKLTAKINGNGPIGNIVVVSDSKGMVKGYVSNPDVDIPLKYEGKLDVGGAVGKDGSITIIKDLGLKKPYGGSYPLVNGEIAEDLTAYFAYSEQQPSAVALGVLVDTDYSIKAAGGFIIQLLPDASEESISILEKNLSNIPPISKLIDEGKKPEDILDIVLNNLDYEILDKYNVDFECDCNKERLEKALISVGKKDLMEILEEDKKAELMCHFCNKKYEFNEDDLKKLIEEI